MCFVGRPGPSMTYFKRRRGVLDHVRVMDPRVLHAAVDHPNWWQDQRALVATKETVIDLSSLAPRDCSDALEKAGIRIVNADGRPFEPRMAEQHGIRGLTLEGKYALRLANPVDQVDVLIAHFGCPPTVRALGQDKQLVSAVADGRPRQVELLRLLGNGIDRLEIDAPERASLVQIALPGHARGGASSNPSRRSGKSQQRSTKNE